MLLNDNWLMWETGRPEGPKYPCRVPCSMYDTLLGAGAIPDPYKGENEWISTPLSDRDCTLETHFALPADIAGEERQFLCLNGVDTLGSVYLNGTLLGQTDNMHRRWEYEVTGQLQGADNALRVDLRSPSRYVTERMKQRPLYCVDQAMPGYPWLRKAHCMFGWDWGPILPDMGLWRDVTLRGYSGGRLLDIYFTQKHRKDGSVLLRCSARWQQWRPGAALHLTVTAPDGERWEVPFPLEPQADTAGAQEERRAEAELEIPRPKLWWVRGLGEQPLYSCQVTLTYQNRTVDTLERRVGLRTLTVTRAKDKWGRKFGFINNGVEVFAMGADYIPEDQLLPRITPERTRRLLEDCKAANYNFIRIWGGGFYPDGSFYDWCDENGFMVWQDFMFACAAYLLEPDFEATVRAEIRDNVLRLRNHASLAMWCGNNEIESAWAYWGLPDDPEAKRDYLRLFEELIPSVLAETDPETFYWPSSPSTGGSFDNPCGNEGGDMHYWAVWHNFKPIEAFRENHFRFCSEYGFESLPDPKTVAYFASEEDRDLCGPVMEAHQKCTQGNEKIMYYLAQMVNYPTTFDRLLYCSQLVQADCIRSNVEHMRRERGRCLGSAYWQVNDSNPVISWASIDYFGRWKALHYAARRFYAPVLLSCDDGPFLAGEKEMRLYITNDTPRSQQLQVRCRLRDHTGQVLAETVKDVEAAALSAAEALRFDLAGLAETREQCRTRYLEYTLSRGEEVLSRGTTLFVRPKSFAFLPVHLQAEVRAEADRFAVTLGADRFAKSLRLSLKKHDAVFSDNWFDLHGDAPVTVFLPRQGALAALSAAQVLDELELTCYNSLL